jgi:hypothetical protein
MHDIEGSNGQSQSVRLKIRYFSLTFLIAQIGCLSLVITFGALFAGMWMDDQLGVRGLCTVAAVLLSVPVTLFLTLSIALKATKRTPFLIAESEPSVSSDRKEVDS